MKTRASIICGILMAGCGGGDDFGYSLAGSLDAGTGGNAGSDASTDPDGGDADAPDAAEEPEAFWCDPTWGPGYHACVIDEQFGIFAAPTGTDDAACGTKGTPCNTLGKAMQRAKAEGKRVYACGDGGAFAENLVVNADIDGLLVFGGLHCADWSYAPTAVRTKVEPASGSAIVVENLVTGVHLRDFAFTSANAVGAGASSIAGIVRDSQNVVFANSVFSAGAGAGGADGAQGAAGETVPSVGPQQQGQSADCSAAPPGALPGGFWPTAFTCAAGGTTRGGTGGNASYERPGDPGLQGAPAVPEQGQGGEGGTVASKNGKNGQAGAAGQPGQNGAGAAAVGTLSAAGYQPADGSNGTNGNPGQGGGGGGASWSKSLCTGASGGAGGMGGCGGFAGTQGTGGGASIGLLVWSSTVTLEQCELTSSSGGQGGKGGSGGAASAGKQGHGGGFAVEIPMENAGQGGLGGNGGLGGSGSGGTGGPSYALAFHGTAPVEEGSVTKTPGQGGAKGAGGVAPGGVAAAEGSVGGAAGEVEIP
jgi:hypothetical protein